MINYKRIVLIIGVVIINNAFSMHNNKYKKETILGRMVTNYPIPVLSGGYLIIKDSVHQELKEHIPYLYVKTQQGSKLFPSTIFFWSHSCTDRITAGFGRYRNVGFCLLLGSLLSNTSFLKEGSSIGIDFKKH